MVACAACRACCWGDIEMPLPLSLAGVDGPVLHTRTFTLQSVTFDDECITDAFANVPGTHCHAHADATV